MNRSMNFQDRLGNINKNENRSEMDNVIDIESKITIVFAESVLDEMYFTVILKMLIIIILYNLHVS